jgi:3-oxoacyl-[acyl-carrier protein] reductase
MLITGTRKGIGKYLAQYYIMKGYNVIGCSRNENNFESEHYEHFCLDVSDEVKVKKMFTKIRVEHGKLDVLINNAGTASMNHFLLTPTSTYHKIFKTNLVGSLLFSREAAKLMQKNRFGRIINFASVATPLKLEGEAVYAASKAAIVNFTEVLARELADMGITVNAVGPTPVKTDLIRNISKEKLTSLLNRQAIPRFGEFEDISNVIDFYIKPESNFVTGQVVYLGGV